MKYLYLPRDTFKTYVEMHVTSRKLTQDKLDFEVNIFQKVKMCKSRTKIKQLPFPSFRKGLDR